MTERILDILEDERPVAYAELTGSDSYPDIRGRVDFYQDAGRVLVSAYFTGLPQTETNIFGFHIHDGVSCGATADFPESGQHYNPGGLPHPRHPGDLPPIFGADGVGLSVFYTNRFIISEVLGKVIILHSAPDDFSTQPSGNAGEKIACGKITATKGAAIPRDLDRDYHYRG